MRAYLIGVVKVMLVTLAAVYMWARALRSSLKDRERLVTIATLREAVDSVHTRAACLRAEANFVSSCGS